MQLQVHSLVFSLGSTELY